MSEVISFSVCIHQNSSDSDLFLVNHVDISKTDRSCLLLKKEADNLFQKVQGIGPVTEPCETS